MITREIERLNQRGGRTLSIVDLLNAGTLDLEVASYVMNRLQAGASVLTCAGPGGTGKSTLLGSLLALLPADASVCVLERSQPATWFERNAATSGRTWFLCHELGRGPWYSYLWGEGARTLLTVSGRCPGCFCATTAHADSIEELRQVLLHSEIGLRQSEVARLDLILFIRALPEPNGLRRRVTEVYAADPGAGEHRRVCHWDALNDRFTWADSCRSVAIDGGKQLLKRLQDNGVLEVSRVRQAVVDYCSRTQERKDS